MRIISGSLKGKKINFLKSSVTRPLKDYVKENIFNIIKHSNHFNVRINHSKILDLYSGVGSFGLECISRGAREVTFVEKDQKASNILKKNVLDLSINKTTKIVSEDVENFLNHNTKDKYQIIFLDPPFGDSKFIENLKLIKKYKFFGKKHIVIIHREKNTKDDYSENLFIILEKIYGRSKVIFGTFT